jgi:hypothetical protein
MWVVNKGWWGTWIVLLAPGRGRCTISDRRCWNPLSLAGLQKGARLPAAVLPIRRIRTTIPMHG